ncbi:MAG: hypothetical protein HY602_03425 [Parcubacteria group bacterium]|nr:hypothetical protein [Parcubacteria group bacterium]
MSNLFRFFTIVCIGISLLGIGIRVFAAWVGPTANPPGNNADAPVNIGSLEQTKAGILRLPTLTVANNLGIGTLNPTQKLEVVGTAKTDKLRLGNKWLLSGVGDAHGNDEWLRLFDAAGTGYYGGVAMGKLWVGGEACIGGTCRTSWPAGNLACGTGATSGWGEQRFDCPGGQIMTGGGCLDNSGYREYGLWYTIPDGNGWKCRNYYDAPVTVYARCCWIQ